VQYTMGEVFFESNSMISALLLFSELQHTARECVWRGKLLVLASSGRLNDVLMMEKNRIRQVLPFS
jgi:hypothetical protein